VYLSVEEKLMQYLEKIMQELNKKPVKIVMVKGTAVGPTLLLSQYDSNSRKTKYPVSHLLRK
jgi:hypothetical protein